MGCVSKEPHKAEPVAPLAEGRKISDAVWPSKLYLQAVVTSFITDTKTHRAKKKKILSNASSRVKKQGEDDVTRATTMDGAVNIGTSGSLLVVNE